MIFFDGSARSLKEIDSALDAFKLLSGLGLNKAKTSLFYAGLNEVESATLDSTGFHLGSLPIRYLGLPLLHRRLRKSDYSPLIDSIKKHTQIWTARTPSYAGRLELIKSVTYSLVNFWLSAFILPKGCLKEIEKICRSYLWAGHPTKRAQSKVSWSQICLPKAEGGLGLRDFSLWNKALILRLVWLLFSNSGSLWVAWNREHRLKRTNYWLAETRQTHSWIWKALLSLRPLARLFLGCKIGNGLSASYWCDDWLPLGPLIHFIGDDGPCKMGIPIRATVAEGCRNGLWRLPSSRCRNVPICTLRQSLLTVQPPSDPQQLDSYTWGFEGQRSDTFSIKITWERLRDSAPKVTWEKAVWFKYHVPRHAFHFWTTNLDRLPTRTRLVSWGLGNVTDCCLCGQQQETRDHLFLHCSIAGQLWSMVLPRLGTPTVTFPEWSDLIQWLLSPTSGLSSTLKKLTVQNAISTLWTERNNRLHNACNDDPVTLFKRLDRTLRDTLLARLPHRRCRRLLAQWFRFS